MSRFFFKDLNVEHICKPNIKHSYISIKPYSKSVSIIVKTPKVSDRFIENMLLEKESWIRKQLFKIQKSKKEPINLEDEVLLFGEIYSIDSDEVKPLRDKLSKIDTENKARVLKCYDIFYKNIAKEYLSKVIYDYSLIMKLEYKELKFRKMRSRWGSCSSTKTITLNSELIKVKKELIEYVVVHELAHLVHMNHSAKFHSLIDVYIPNSKLKRKELKSIYLLADLK